MNVLKKLFNSLNNSSYSYVVKKDIRQVTSLCIVLIVLLCFSNVIQRAIALNVPKISEEEKKVLLETLSGLKKTKKETIINTETAECQSVKCSKRDSLIDKYFVFDPNFITREEFYKLGFSTKQIEAFMKLRDEKGKKFYVKKDFSTVFFIDNQKYRELEKYIKIDLPRLFDGKKFCDLNLASLEELVEVGFSFSEADKVIKFREDVGYFYAPWQLSDCIKFERANVLKNSVYTCLSVEIKKININKVTLEELEKHPYFTDFQAKKIVEYLSLGKTFSHIADLQTLNAFSDKDLKKLQHYLTF